MSLPLSLLRCSSSLAGHPIRLSEEATCLVDACSGQEATARLSDPGASVLADVAASTDQPTPVEVEVSAEGLEPADGCVCLVNGPHAGVSSDVGEFACLRGTVGDVDLPDAVRADSVGHDRLAAAVEDEAGNWRVFRLGGDVDSDVERLHQGNCE